MAEERRDAPTRGRLVSNVTETASGSFVLSPDPTALTNQLVDKAREDIRRELSYVEHGLTQRIEAVLQLLSLRVDAIDTATQLVQEWRDKLPAQLDLAMTQAGRNVMERFLRVDERFNTQNEKFASVDQQFQERDVRMEQSTAATRLATEQAASSVKLAIDAALQAQKEAVAAQNTNIAQALSRIEQTAQKQIEQLVTLLQTTAGAQNDKVDDIKERVTLIEGRTAGITTATTTQREVVGAQLDTSKNIQGVVAIGLSVFFGLITIVLTVVMLLRSGQP